MGVITVYLNLHWLVSEFGLPLGGVVWTDLLQYAIFSESYSAIRNIIPHLVAKMIAEHRKRRVSGSANNKPSDIGEEGPIPSHLGSKAIGHISYFKQLLALMSLS